MPSVTIENPILNSPFLEPRRHFRFTDEGISNEIIESRRKSSYFIPIPKSKKRGKQMLLATEWVEERIEENRLINEIRERVRRWGDAGRPGVTPATRKLLDHWTHPDRERKLFFAQIEALETAIYILEIASRHGDSWIENDLTKVNAAANPGRDRIAFKMATGSGKTVVMAMLIA